MSDSTERPKQQDESVGTSHPEARREGKEPSADTVKEDVTIVETVKDYLGLQGGSTTSGGDSSAAKGGDEETDTQKPKHQVSDKEAATRENKSAIPTAGGERLGEKNWGRSKFVPENPPPQQDEGGPKVSSKDGQPTEQVRDNTSKNAGGGAAPDGKHGPEKEKFGDKLKDKLHVGHHKE